MSRRTKDDAWIWAIPQLLGVLMLLGLISPQVRQTAFAVGFVFVCLLVLAVLGLIGFGVYRWTTQSQRINSSDRVFLSSVPCANAPPVNLSRIEAPAKTNSTPPQTAELLEQLRSIDWFQFENLIGCVYRKLGYNVNMRGGANPDGGIDLVVEKDGQRSAVQCKQWKTWNVGVKSVREFLGALTDAGIQKGIFITLCGYTGEAKLLAEKHGIQIINETGLAQMLEAIDARFDLEVLAILRDTRKLCPKCESNLVLRTRTKGPGAGKQFWGCSRYPRCRFTMPASETVTGLRDNYK